LSQLSFQHSEYQDKKTLFAEVLLPLHLPGTFTYRIPFDWAERAKEGCRVVAPLGKS
jgi:primosomal protein N' (replication factor Y) (superfamily II helicase)